MLLKGVDSSVWGLSRNWGVVSEFRLEKIKPPGPEGRDQGRKGKPSEQ